MDEGEEEVLMLSDSYREISLTKKTSQGYTVIFVKKHNKKVEEEHEVHELVQLIIEDATQALDFKERIIAGKFSKEEDI